MQKIEFLTKIRSYKHGKDPEIRNRHTIFKLMLSGKF
jgi:hypothetical protein